MKQPIVPSHVERARRLFARNALFTATCAAPMAIEAPSLAGALFGDARWAGLLTAIGIALLGYAATLGLARRSAPRHLRRWLLAFASADVAWVVGSGWILLGAPSLLTATGQFVVIAVAAVVGVFGVQQARLGLARQG